MEDGSASSEGSGKGLEYLKGQIHRCQETLEWGICVLTIGNNTYCRSVEFVISQ